jgi:enediyne biosynthesis protein E4
MIDAPAEVPGPVARRRRSVAVVAFFVVIALVVASLVLWRSYGATKASGGAAPHYVDESASSGINHSYTGQFEFFVGGGVATFDCNGDGRDELYVAGGTSPAALYINESPVGGALAFTPKASPVTDLTDVTGAYPIDIDSDGITDLVVLRRNGNHVLRGLGNCVFDDATAALGVEPGKDWTVGFSAIWEGKNTLPTLAFGNYLVPGGDTCGDSRLVRPTTDSTYAPPIALSPGYCTLSILFSDWNHTGHHDLRMANDRHYYATGEEQLWKVTPGEAPRQYTEADGWHALTIWGMGIASRDLDGDGKPEVFITSQGDNKLQALEGDGSTPSYHDIALAKGVTTQRPYTGGDVLPSTAWHPQFDDVNNDGHPDLLVTKGNVSIQVDNAQRDPSDLMIGRADGTFAEGAVAAGIVNYDKARGAAMVDLNLDGLLDLVIVNREVNVRVYRNVGSGTAAKPAAMGNWLAVRLHQPAPNVDAIGAWLDVRVAGAVSTREITIGGGHASGSLDWIHTGLGSAKNAEVRVEWPDGTTGQWMPVTANQFVTIDKGAAAPAVWTPPT